MSSLKQVPKVTESGHSGLPAVLPESRFLHSRAKQHFLDLQQESGFLRTPTQAKVSLHTSARIAQNHHFYHFLTESGNPREPHLLHLLAESGPGCLLPMAESWCSGRVRITREGEESPESPEGAKVTILLFLNFAPDPESTLFAGYMPVTSWASGRPDARALTRELDTDVWRLTACPDLRRQASWILPAYARARRWLDHQPASTPPAGLPRLSTPAGPGCLTTTRGTRLPDLHPRDRAQTALRHPRDRAQTALRHPRDQESLPRHHPRDQE